MKKTAIEWLESKLYEFETIQYSLPTGLYEYLEQAKEIEKEQQGYSEEEVLELLNNLRVDSYNHGMGRIEFLEWFEQFKKK